MPFEVSQHYLEEVDANFMDINGWERAQWRNSRTRISSSP